MAKAPGKPRGSAPAKRSRAAAPKPSDPKVSAAILGSFLQAQVPMPRIAAAMGMSQADLERAIRRDTRLSKLAEQSPSQGLARLQLRMMTAALAGNVPMMLFLGKNYLGMSEKVDTTTHLQATVLELPTPATVEEWEASAAALQERQRLERQRVAGEAGGRDPIAAEAAQE